MNEIEKIFLKNREDGRISVIPFLTAGYPSVSATKEMVLEFHRIGCRIVELGIPFSDPMADGPTIQYSSMEALKKGINIDRILGVVKSILRKCDISIFLMTYMNPLVRYGFERFARNAKRAGVSGLIIPDLPFDEEGRYREILNKHGLHLVLFASLTSNRKRLTEIIKRTTAFIYFVSVLGVTGRRNGFPRSTINKLKQIRKITAKPVCVGFGISSCAHVKSITGIADGAIVGSAIIDVIVKNRKSKNLVRRVGSFVKGLIRS